MTTKLRPDGTCYRHPKLGWFWKLPEEYSRTGLEYQGYKLEDISILKTKELEEVIKRLTFHRNALRVELAQSYSDTTAYSLSKVEDLITRLEEGRIEKKEP